MAKVLNKYRDGIPKGAVYIGRPSKWGNPFAIGKDGDRDEVIAKYRQWLLARPDMMEAAKRELFGKDLVCFCAPKGCHGDVLLEVANKADDGGAWWCNTHNREATGRDADGGLCCDMALSGDAKACAVVRAPGDLLRCARGGKG